MHVLFTRFPLESSFGGAEVQTLSLMKGLREKGLTVDFVGSCPTLLEHCAKEKIRNRELCIGEPPVTKLGAVSFAWRQRNMKKKLQKMIENHHDPGVICMLSLSEKLLLTRYAIEQGWKVVWVEHDRVGSWLTKNPWLPRLRKLSKLVTTVVVSDLSKDIYRKLKWQGDLMTIMNGVEIPKASVSPRALRLRSGQAPTRGQQLNIGCITRLSKDKGVDVLLHSLIDLDVYLHILGRGKDAHALHNKAHQSLPTTHYRFTEFIEDIEEFYTSIDLLVLPSREHDPFGLVAAESLVRGIPVIVTDACGIARHLEPDEAVIVPAGDVASLRDAITNYQLRITNDVLKRLRKRFSVATMIDQYEKLVTRNS